jgi:bacillithiol system protein YtxJ
MDDSLTTLRDADHLDELLADSHALPVLLFKHSQSCGTSFEALDELLAYRAERADSLRYAMVTVQQDRELSNAIAKRFNVRHETPQVILVREGQVVWTASHFRINSRSLDQALAMAVPAT